MKRILLAVIAVAAVLTLQAKPKQAKAEQVTRVEPPCWWTGMTTELQLMVQGPQISDCEVIFEKGPKVTRVHKADNPNFIFVDVEVPADL